MIELKKISQSRQKIKQEKAENIDENVCKPHVFVELASHVNKGTVVKTAILEQDPPNHKIVDVCLHHHCGLTSKDGVFVA